VQIANEDGKGTIISFNANVLKRLFFRNCFFVAEKKEFS
jgi:hypothetical protein